MFGDILLKIGAVAFMVFFFGFCIFIHELGHFLAAKWRGLHVIAFSIGFRKIWSKKIGGVEYRIGWIPFGGYVEIPQVDASGEALDEDGKPLPKAKPLDRMIAVVAGPLFNILFGFALGTVVWICGVPQDTPTLKEIEVESIEEKSPEYNAGLRTGDVIYKLNGETFDTTWNGFVSKILFTIGEVKLGVKRDGKEFEVSYFPAVNKKISPEEGIAYPFFFPKIPVYLYPEKNSQLAELGIKSGDRLILVDGRKINELGDLSSILLFESNGKPMTLTVLRDGRELVFKDVKPTLLKESDGSEGGYYLRMSENPLLRVPKGSPLEKAGLKKGDRIVSLDGTKINEISDVRSVIDKTQGKTLKAVYERDGRRLETDITPVYVRYYALTGVNFAMLTHPTPWAQFENVIVMTWKSLRGIGVSIGKKLNLTEKYTTIEPKHMSGPIGIGRYLYTSVYYGSVIQGLMLVVLITFNLGLLNLLPIPVLDGGHIVLALLEIIFRRPMPQKILEPITIGFVVLLVSFMLFVSFYDVKKLATPLIRSMEKDGEQKTENVEQESQNVNVKAEPVKAN